MPIVHYMHLNKLWYYWLDNSNKKKYWRKLETKEDFERVTLLSEDILTEREAKELLRRLFPTNKIMKAIPYHFSRSKRGSRPFKSTVDRKGELKEKLNFKKELEDLYKKG